MAKTTQLISLDQIDCGLELNQSIGTLVTKVEELNPDNFRLITVPIKESDLSTYLQSKINGMESFDPTELENQINNLESFKADKSYVIDNYRNKAVLITKKDLSEDINTILNNMEHNGFDPTHLQNQINQLGTTKLSELQADALYRRLGIPITREDLDPTLLSFINNFQSLSNSITKLDNDKADKTALANYRLKNVSITTNDLSSNLQQILETIPKEFNPTYLENKINELNTNKVDKSTLNLYTTTIEADKKYRLVSVKIDETDLSTALQNKLTNIPEGYDPNTYFNNLNTEIVALQKDKLDKVDAVNFRLKSTFISEKDLDKPLQEKIDAIAEKPNLEPLITAINNLQSSKLSSDDASKLYRSLKVKLVESDLSTDLQLKINNVSYDDTELRNDVKNITTNIIPTLVTETSLDTTLEGYRSTSVKINEDQLSPDVISKLNTVSNGYDDSEIKADIANLEKNKVNNVALNDYRNKEIPIGIDDLTKSLQDQIKSQGDLANLEIFIQKLTALENTVKLMQEVKTIIQPITLNADSPNVIQLNNFPVININTLEFTVNGIEYFNNKDFTLNAETGTITWTNSDFPLTGDMRVIVEYEVRIANKK